MRSMALRSSRTFPGQSWPSSMAIAGSEIGLGWMRFRRQAASRKWRARRGMSSRRSRRGGTVSWTTSSR